MKIAKKVLALVMALAMIGALTVMAFAQGTYAITAEKDGETVIARVALKNGAGTLSDSFTVKYDPAVLKIADPDMDVESGKDVVDLKNNVPETVNTLMGAPNIGGLSEGTQLPLGEILYGYAFSQALSPEYIKAARGKTTNIDVNDFEFLVIYFTVLNDKVDTTIQVLDANGAVAGTATIKGAAAAEEPSQAEEKPTEAEKPEETKANEEATKVEEGTKASNPGTGDKKTGDNMALAAAGAVVALAGVAFVISKKRK